jgi:DNA-binding IclR family transcriptional regulator
MKTKQQSSQLATRERIDSHTSNSPGSVPALDRSLDLLELLSTVSEGLTLSKLSKQLNAPKNAVFRITQTLLARGYLSRDPETMAFQLTGQMLKLAPPCLGGFSLPAVANNAMRVLRNITRETVQLGVLDGLEGVIIDQVEGLEPLRIVVNLGLRFALHNNAPGKLLLAHLPEGQRESVIAQLQLTSSTSRTITSKSALQEECDRILKDGYSTDHAEADEGIHCVAAPIFERGGVNVLGALWISGPAKRLPKSKFKELGNQVRAAGDQVSLMIDRMG